MTNQPRKPSSDLSRNHAAMGAQTGGRMAGPLPSFRALLENGKVSRWRLSLGALLHGLVVSMLLMLPLATTEHLNGERPQGTVYLFPITKGSPDAVSAARPDQSKPHAHKPTLSDLLEYHVQTPDPSGTEGGPQIITAGPDPGQGMDLPLGILDGWDSGLPFGEPPGSGQTLNVPLPKPPAPTQPVRVGGKVREPRLVRRVEPAYPRLAKQAGIEGRVELQALLDVSGRVTHIEVKRGHPALISAATNAVSQWAYEPTHLNDRPVPVILKVVVEFRLRK